MNQLKIQSKLLFSIGLIIIIGALNLGANIYNLIQMDRETNKMFTQIQKLESSHQAGVITQNMELSQRALFDRRADNAIVTHAQVSNELDIFINESFLSNPSIQEKKLLVDLSSEKDNYDQIFADTISEYEKGPDNINYVTYDNLREDADRSTDSLFNHIDSIIFLNVDQLQEATELSDQYAKTSIIIGNIALGIFAISAYLIIAMISAQVYQPILAIRTAVSDIRQNKFEPDQLNKLSKKQDEMGKLAQVFLEMDTSIKERIAQKLSEKEDLSIKLERQNR